MQSSGIFRRLQRQRPGTPGGQLLFYAFARLLANIFLAAFYRMRVHGGRGEIPDGALLIVANHQSYLDPPAIGAALHQRQLDYIARAGLFRSRFMGWLLTQFHSLPIREDASDTAAIKEVLRRLESGRVVLIFPEGTRSPDGAMRPFKRGVAVLVKRARCPVLPVAIEGAFDAWPRDRKRPRLMGKRLAVSIGEPISYDALMAAGADAALVRLATEIDAMRLKLRGHLRRDSGDTFPPAGPGDLPLDLAAETS